MLKNGIRSARKNSITESYGETTQADQLSGLNPSSIGRRRLPCGHIIFSVNRLLTIECRNIQGFKVKKKNINGDTGITMTNMAREIGMLNLFAGSMGMI